MVEISLENESDQPQNAFSSDIEISESQQSYRTEHCQCVKEFKEQITKEFRRKVDAINQQIEKLKTSETDVNEREK